MITSSLKWLAKMQPTIAVPKAMPAYAHTLGHHVTKIKLYARAPAKKPAIPPRMINPMMMNFQRAQPATRPKTPAKTKPVITTPIDPLDGSDK